MSTPSFLLDEHVWGGLVKVGQKLKLDVRLVQCMLPPGAKDEDVLALAAGQKRVLFTSNAQDFAPLAVEWFLAGKEHSGIIIVPGQTDRGLLSRALSNIQEQCTAESLKNTFRFIQEFT
jgi:hypothetical protein